MRGKAHVVCVIRFPSGAWEGTCQVRAGDADAPARSFSLKIVLCDDFKETAYLLEEVVDCCPIHFCAFILIARK